MSARRHAALAFALVLSVSARFAQAQEFSALPAAGPRPGPASLLADGLPAAGGAPALESALTRWFAIPGFETHALAAALPARSRGVTAPRARSVRAVSPTARAGRPAAGRGSRRRRERACG